MRLWNAVDPEHPTKARECGVEVLLELPGESTEGLGDIPDTQALLDVAGGPAESRWPGTAPTGCSASSAR